jgi:sigma-B regulation protein RsbU (phosphoserine phosphatase)
VSSYLARIIVVDDNEMNRDMLSRRLTKQGYDIVAVSSGQEALDEIAANDADLVLLDIMMPGMDGFEVLRRIRETRSQFELPVIMATAKDEGTDVVRALDMGANDYVTKPFDYPVVKARVATQVQLKHSHEELKASNARMANDLAAAARVQSSLLPKEDLAVDGYKFAWRYHPCDELAGDALNIHRLDDGKIIFYLLDVSGHGVPSALLSVSIVHSLHPAPGPSSVIWEAREDGAGFNLLAPSHVAERLNALYPIMENGGLYFTMIYGILDPGTRSLRLVMAGHPQPVKVGNDGSAELLGEVNPPIGVIDGVEYAEAEYILFEGDRLLFYSDGLTEMFGPEDEMFGEDRLMEYMDGSRAFSLPKCLDGVTEYVLGWSGRNRYEDDLSLLALDVE